MWSKVGDFSRIQSPSGLSRRQVRYEQSDLTAAVRSVTLTENIIGERLLNISRIQVISAI